ncbi:hypothetical protein K438DRAFT_1884422 [Mycena galopus ATCC 62051]|nr:hypothetical protein K438DRAFT_1884422 [Mycena galopus ATCC 62051]
MRAAERSAACPVRQRQRSPPSAATPSLPYLAWRCYCLPRCSRRAISGCHWRGRCYTQPDNDDARGRPPPRCCMCHGRCCYCRSALAVVGLCAEAPAHARHRPPRPRYCCCWHGCCCCIVLSPLWGCMQQRPHSPQTAATPLLLLLRPTVVSPLSGPVQKCPHPRYAVAASCSCRCGATCSSARTRRRPPPHRHCCCRRCCYVLRWSRRRRAACRSARTLATAVAGMGAAAASCSRRCGTACSSARARR